MQGCASRTLLLAVVQKKMVPEYRVIDIELNNCHVGHFLERQIVLHCNHCECLTMCGLISATHDGGNLIPLRRIRPSRASNSSRRNISFIVCVLGDTADTFLLKRKVKAK